MGAGRKGGRDGWGGVVLPFLHHQSRRKSHDPKILLPFASLSKRGNFDADVPARSQVGREGGREGGLPKEERE